MDGKSLVAAQERGGVRLLVAELDELRTCFGVSAVKVLTPRAEVKCAKLLIPSFSFSLI